MEHWKAVPVKRDRGYYANHFTASELRRMLREAEDHSTGADSDMYLIQEISAAPVSYTHLTLPTILRV